jgi:seryl-tRNA synthetase
MISLDDLRNRPDVYKKACIDKKYYVDIDRILVLDTLRKTSIPRIEEIRAERNAIADAMKGGKPDPALIATSKELKDALQREEESLEPIETELNALLKLVPNVPSTDTPIGTSEDDNVEVYTWGAVPAFAFTPKNHWELAQLHDWIDKDRASKVAGARFAYVKGPLVHLQLALMQYVMHTLSDTNVIAAICTEFKVDADAKPFTPVLPPYMIRTEVFDAMDRLEPREDRYKIEGEELWLQGSAEHVLGSMYMNETLAVASLPIRLLGYASSFRKEAGTYGKDMEGIIRMHQFDKLEMEIIATPEQGLNEHLLTVAIQEYLVRSLELPYRKLLKCTADIGKPNVRGVDIEVWFPGQSKYRETHTADYMTDYQSRRMKTKTKLVSGEIVFIHTIDATAFAIGRIMVGILENNQQADGTVRVPAVLQPYMGGMTVLV